MGENTLDKSHLNSKCEKNINERVRQARRRIPETSFRRFSTRMSFRPLMKQFVAGNPDEITISGVAWAEGGLSKTASRQENLMVKFGSEGAVQIPLSRTLKIIEQRTVSSIRIIRFVAFPS